MISTYTISDYQETDTTVKVQYTNHEGFVHSRNINIPHLEDGSIDQERFNEILEGQLRGVNNKESLGVISFVDPNAVEENEEGSSSP
jgi:type I site-specific restriction-modification system R (restriction) subunit